MLLSRANAIVHELRLDLLLRNARRRERSAHVRLGEAAASAGAAKDVTLLPILAVVQQGRSRLDALQSAVAKTLEDDRSDFAAARWMRPVVVLRGLCARAVLGHQMALIGRTLSSPHEAIGIAVAGQPLGSVRLPRPLLNAVADASAAVSAILDERSRRLSPFGGSALPTWFPHVGQESTVLGRALWQQLRSTILPRGSALAGLAVGWWLGSTYTDSHLRSALSSLGLSHGGRRVVSGETYRAMMFWLPLLAAALFAYLADRAHLLIRHRYNSPTPPP